MLAGVLWRNFGRIPPRWEPGIALLAKPILRWGIVLLGFKIVFDDLINLGPSLLLLAVAVVGLGLAGSYAICRCLGMSHSQSILIASGFSICGAAAVAGASSVTKSRDEDISLAVGLVVVFGTLMILVVPLLAGAFSLSDHQAALLAGAATHEVAQVVVIGGMFGTVALATAVVMKLARVVLLAPVMLTLNLISRFSPQPVDTSRKAPPLVPLFVVGFILAMTVRSLIPIAPPVLDVLNFAQGILLAAAMFGLGCSVRIATWKTLGARPFVAGGICTIWVTGIALAGVLLLT